MRKYEYEVVTKKEAKCVEHSCDICGKKSKDPEDDNWSEVDYMYESVRIEKTSGFRDAWEDDTSVEKDFDICAECFDNLVVPFLESKIAHIG